MAAAEAEAEGHSQPAWSPTAIATLACAGIAVHLASRFGRAARPVVLSFPRHVELAPGGLPLLTSLRRSTPARRSAWRPAD
jgi:hypothetical protein